VTAPDYETVRHRLICGHAVAPRVASRGRVAVSESGDPAAEAAGTWGRRIAPVRTALGLGLAIGGLTGLLALSVAVADDRPGTSAQAGLMLGRLAGAADGSAAPSSFRSGLPKLGLKPSFGHYRQAVA